MNKKGQTLVLFVILMPVIIALFAYVFDISITINEKIKLNNIKNVAEKYLKEEKSEEEVKKLIKKNNKNIKINKIDSNTKEVELEITTESFFGKALGIKSYRIKTK